MAESNRKSKIDNGPAPDPRHVKVREEIWRVYNEANGDLQCPWSGKHAKILQRVLATATNWRVEQWHSCILNRFASDGVNPAEDPAEWMPYLVRYAHQPLNRFGKTDGVPQKCWDAQKRLCDRYWEIYPEEIDGTRGSGARDSDKFEG